MVLNHRIICQILQISHPGVSWHTCHENHNTSLWLHHYTSCNYATCPYPQVEASSIICRRNHALTRWVGVPRSQPHFGWLSIQSRQTSQYLSSRRCLKKKMPSWPVCVSHRSAPQYARSLKKKMSRWPVCVFHRSAPQYARCPDRLSFGETMP